MWFPVAGFRLPEDRKPATGNRQLLGGPHPPLRLQRVWRVGILHGDAPVGFLRFHAVALRVVRVRQKDQQRIGRKNGIALVDFPLQLAGDLSRFAILDALRSDGGELFLLNQRLHAFLRCVMLIDLGIPESALKEPILYQSTRWKLL